MAKHIDIITGTFGKDAEETLKYIEILKSHGFNRIDTAALYGDGEDERKLGSLNLSESSVIIDTKAKSGFGEGASRAAILKDFERSRSLLGRNVDIFYLHSYDRNTPLEETLGAVNEIYQTGFFKRFGLSNFPVEAVEEAHAIAKAKGYPLPSVFQANYSAAARHLETSLFPTLRRLGISVAAYSPIAGGLLTKSRDGIVNGKGRWDPSSFIGGLYHELYNKPEILDALTQWEEIAKAEGISRANLAYRWIYYSSALSAEHGDALVIGASSTAQLEETLAAIKQGPLSADALKKIDHFWETIKSVAPTDNVNGKF